ncbi:hypothetical protein CFP71_28060 [Amycolatopsis thailandensis]|uniref:PPM-type phosphatase domain-containing protein n=1 Tax=Amycolatopsis thailandensis TaxID=589330 RepID=A0A229RUD8_9PSEU|nr:hypothetical protein [Amycolatopsis thailandensis]OXM50288.1 hypothetical protein CFP71_28060 [Amycolatopsis thailandensis]
MTSTTSTVRTWELLAPRVERGRTTTVATATRAGGGRTRNCDAAAVAHYATAGTVSAAVVDGKGTSAETAATMAVCAQAAARYAARYGALQGLLDAGRMIADPGQRFADVDGVAAVAVVRPGAPTTVVHVGRARAYTWDGAVLHRLTEDHTHGQQLRHQGHTEAQAAAQDHLQRVTLARSSVGTAPTVLTDDRLVLLTTDGVHDALTHDQMTALVRASHHDSAALADALVAAAARYTQDGQADDATVAVIALG